MTADAFAGSNVRHGTSSGWSKHQALGERPCDDCYRAKAAYDARRVAASDVQKRQWNYARAQGRARSRLQAIYPDIYRVLYEEEKAKIAREEQL